MDKCAAVLPNAMCYDYKDDPFQLQSCDEANDDLSDLIQLYTQRVPDEYVKQCVDHVLKVQCDVIQRRSDLMLSRPQCTLYPTITEDMAMCKDSCEDYFETLNGLNCTGDFLPTNTTCVGLPSSSCLDPSKGFRRGK